MRASLGFEVAGWQVPRHKQRMIELRFAGYQPARSVHTRALHALSDLAGRRAAGKLAIQVTDSIVSLGHKAADLLDMVEKGELDGCYFASSYLSGRVPALDLFDQPFEAGSREKVFGGLDGGLGATLAGAVAKVTGFHVLAWWDNGIRHISNRVRPIRTPRDCAGLRLRTLDNRQHQEAFRRIGFRPIFVDVADLPGAVAEGAVDAQENPLTNMVNFELYRHHRFVSLTGHLLGVALLLMNRARYQSLAGDIRQALDAAARESQVVQHGLATAEDLDCLRMLHERGVEVIAADTIDQQAFRKAAAAPDGH